MHQMGGGRRSSGVEQERIEQNYRLKQRRLQRKKKIKKPRLDFEKGRIDEDEEGKFCGTGGIRDFDR